MKLGSLRSFLLYATESFMLIQSSPDGHGIKLLWRVVAIKVMIGGQGLGCTMSLTFSWVVLENGREK